MLNWLQDEWFKLAEASELEKLLTGLVVGAILSLLVIIPLAVRSKARKKKAKRQVALATEDDYSRRRREERERDRRKENREALAGLLILLLLLALVGGLLTTGIILFGWVMMVFVTCIVGLIIFFAWAMA